MSKLNESEVSRIAELIAGRMRGVHSAPAAPPASAPAPVSTPAPVSAPAVAEDPAQGLFTHLDTAVDAARKAFGRLSTMRLDVRRRIIDAIRESMLNEAETLARLAHDETGLGRFEDKVSKNRLAAQKTPGPEALGSEASSGDRGLTLFEDAPYGVIGAITPVTNATSTLICNTIGMVAAGNSVVFNVHPAARKAGCRTVALLNRAIASAGGPESLVTAVTDPTIESAQALMGHPDVRLLVVTGGAGVVRQAMTSGKRAICAGPGNPPVVVDETADLDQAGRDIVRGASFDNNIVCVDEKEVFVTAPAADRLMASMKVHGGFHLTAGQLHRLEEVIFDEVRGPGRPAVVNKEMIGKNASVILATIGVNAGPETCLAFAEVPGDHPLVATEQMMPVLPVVRVENAKAAIEAAVRAERANGHSAVMHSKNLDHLSRMAREINTSIFVKNGPSHAGLGAGGEGFCSLTIASPTGEGMTGPRDFSRQRRCVVVDHFRIV